MPGLNIYFHRRTTRFIENRPQHEPSVFENEFYLQINNNNGSISAVIYRSIVEEIEKIRTKLSDGRAISAIDPNFKEFYTNQIAGLTEIHRKIVLEAEEERRNQQKYFGNYILEKAQWLRYLIRDRPVLLR